MHLAKNCGKDHMRQQQELLEHQQRQQPHYSPQHNQRTTENQRLRTHLLNDPQSDSAFPPVSPTQPLKLEHNATPPITPSEKDTVTTKENTEVTDHRQTETVTASLKEGNKKEDRGTSDKEDAAKAGLANQGKGKDSSLISGGVHLTDEERKQKILETVQRELDQDRLHPHHPQQRPRPHASKTGTAQLPESVC